MSSTPSSSLHPSSFITQPLVETRRFYCPFLKRGFCRASSRCDFSHDNVGSIKIPSEYCHFYLANQCLYGADCKFRHSEPVADDQDDSSSNNPYDNSIISSTNISSSSSNHIADDRHYNHDSQQHQQEEQFQQSSSFTSTPVSCSSTTRHKTPISEDNTNHNHHHHHSEHLTQYGGDSTHLLLTSDDYSLEQQQQEDNNILFPTAQCSYLNGLECDLCGRLCLHPYDLEQQRQHREECLHEHEREMELSFAVQRSKDKVCGICMDTVVEKKPITSSRFGILEKCNHIFCLGCIRKWRGTKQFETRTIRACPECRVSSDFVVPSKYWIEDQDDKEKLINDYKAALRSKPCKYFDEGKGDCPFAGSCFYKHAYPDGRIAKLGAPKPRRRFDSEAVANLILWNILTSTDDDDWSDDDAESLYPDQLGYSDDDDEEDEEENDEDDDDDHGDRDEAEEGEEDDVGDDHDHIRIASRTGGWFTNTTFARESDHNHPDEDIDIVDEFHDVEEEGFDDFVI